jgi:hypothetical protein
LRVREDTRRLRRLVRRGAQILRITIKLRSGRWIASIVCPCPPLHASQQLSRETLRC